MNGKQNISNILNRNCLVAVYLQIIGKGNIKKHATICMPESSDIVINGRVLEPHHQDNNVKLRKQKRLEHRKTLKKVKRRNIKNKKKVSMCIDY